MNVRVRFAPSPTGALHVGGARTALFNWFFARHHNGKFILRIEDTDQVRSTDEAIKAIYDGLEWLGLDWDEGPKVGGPHGPYCQTERLAIYKEHIDRLIKEGKAYYCFCTPEELDKKRKESARRKEAPKYDGSCRKLSTQEINNKLASNIPCVIRFLIPAGEITEIDDLSRGKVTFENDLLDDFVLMKSDGFPTYNFAAVIDDSLMEITHIIRGDDHISNTPRQILLYGAFGFKLPKFAHIPMILGSDKARLSKRHGATSVIAYRDLGYLPEAMINYLARLGWGYRDQEIFSREELIEKFSLEGVSRNPAIFDTEKLNWLNGQYIKKAIPERIVDLCEPLLLDAYGKIDFDYLTAVIKLFLDRIRVIPEVVGLTNYFFVDDFAIDEKAAEYLKDPQAKELLIALKNSIEKLEPFTKPAIEAAFKGLAKEKAVKLGVIIHPCRAALTGRVESPGIYDVVEVLGKEKVVNRLNSVIK